MSRILCGLFCLMVVTLRGGVGVSLVVCPGSNESLDEPPYYREAWKRVDSLNRNGLFREGMGMVEAIRNRALVERNAAQRVKSLTYLVLYLEELEEEGSLLGLQRLEEGLPSAIFPENAILHSLLAQGYANYLRRESWQIMDRQEVVGERPADRESWTIRHFEEAIAIHFIQSLDYPETKTYPLMRMAGLLQDGQRRHWAFQTLYDLLAYRAISYFSTHAGEFSKPADALGLQDTAAFALATQFVKHQFSQVDTTSFLLLTLRLFQQVLSFHLADTDPGVQIDFDRQRLLFVQRYWEDEERPDLFILRLQHLLQQFPNHPGNAETLFLLAKERLRQDDLTGASRHLRQAIAQFPNAFGTQLCRKELADLEAKQCGVTLEASYLPNRLMLAKIGYRNVKSFQGGIVPLSPVEYRRVRQGFSGKEEAAFLAGKIPSMTIKEILPQDGDLRYHETEIALKGLPLGQYMLVFQADDSDFSQVSFQVTRLGAYVRQGDGQQVSFQVMDRENGAPLSGVRIEAIPVERIYPPRDQPRFTFGGNFREVLAGGSLDFPLPTGAYTFRLGRGKDTFVMDEVVYVGESLKESPQRVLKSQFYTDRRMYRPGQTLYWKALLMEKDGEQAAKVSPNTEVVISINDANGTLITQQRTISNAMGSVHGQFDLPQGLLRGVYSLVSSHGGQATYIRVEEYQRPGFEIVLDKLPPQVLGDTLAFRGNTLFYTGLPVVGSRVRWELHVIPETRGVMSVGIPRGRRQFLVAGEVLTDSNGSFNLQLPTAGAGITGDSGFKVFEVAMDITAASGEMQQEKASFRLGTNRTYLQAEWPDSWDRASGSPSLSIGLRDANGEIAEGEVRVSIAKLSPPRRTFLPRKWAFPDRPIWSREQYIARFPALPYRGEESPDSLEIQETLSEQLLLVNGSKKLEIPVPTDGFYRITLSTAGDGKRQQQLILHGFVTDTRMKNVASSEPLAIFPLKTSYLPTDTLSIILAASPQVNQVLVLLNSSEQAFRIWMDLSQMNRLRIPLAAFGTGPALLEVLSYQPEGPVALQRQFRIDLPPQRLAVRYTRFTEKASPGQKISWKINIAREGGGSGPIEAVATLFDASLESLVPHNWSLDPPETFSFGSSPWEAASIFLREGYALFKRKEDKNKGIIKIYPLLNPFSLREETTFSRRVGRGIPAPPVLMQGAPPEAVMSAANLDRQQVGLAKQAAVGSQVPEDIPRIRQDFSETVLFLPQLKPDAAGDIDISFTMKDALTRWKWMICAHGTDLAQVISERTVVTNLPFMVQPQVPRFLRQGDVLKLPIVLSSTGVGTSNGRVMLQVRGMRDGMDLTPVIVPEGAIREVELVGGKPHTLEITLSIPTDIEEEGLEWLIRLEMHGFSDVVRELIPVLPNRILVTESTPFLLRPGEKISLPLPGKRSSGTDSLHSFALELTANPVWTALKALPFLMEGGQESSDQLFRRLFANALGTHLLQQYPGIGPILESWRAAGHLDAELNRQQELKSIGTAETPWVQEAADERAQRENLVRFLDLETMTRALDQAGRQLAERQAFDGSWSWFPGGRGNWFITQYILAGWGKLRQLGIVASGSDGAMVDRSFRFCDAQVREAYQRDRRRKRMEDLPDLLVHYLYTHSLFPGRITDAQTREAIAFYAETARRVWLKGSISQHGQLALFWFRNGEKPLALQVIRSLNDRAIRSRELGMYWKLRGDYDGYEPPVETQSLLIEAFAVTGFNPPALAEMKLALLREKQVQRWGTSMATAEAVYAILSGGSEPLPIEDAWPFNLTFAKGGEGFVPIDKAQQASGEWQRRWQGDEWPNLVGDLRVENRGKGVAWGASHRQVFREIGQMKEFLSPQFSLTREYLVRRADKTGVRSVPLRDGDHLSKGDRLTVKLTLRSDRDMAFVHLRDLRAAGFEPEKVLSGYENYGGIAFYRSSGDTGTDFFFDTLPKGTYVLEYGLRVEAIGRFSVGPGTIQCLYAPAFGSHTRGVTLNIDK